MSYRTLETVMVRVFAIAMLTLIAVHTYGVIRAIDARVQTSLSALER